MPRRYFARSMHGRCSRSDCELCYVPTGKEVIAIYIILAGIVVLVLALGLT